MKKISTPKHLLCWTRLKTEKPFATSKELTRKNSAVRKIMQVFSQRERTDRLDLPSCSFSTGSPLSRTNVLFEWPQWFQTFIKRTCLKNLEILLFVISTLHLFHYYLISYFITNWFLLIFCITNFDIITSKFLSYWPKAYYNIKQK